MARRRGTQKLPPLSPAPRTGPSSGDRPPSERARGQVQGEGRWVGGANPDAHVHRCAPPMRHIGCCDGRRDCISGIPAGAFGATWLCDCGRGWRVGDACDVADAYGEDRHSAGHHAIGGGVCVVGTKWRAMGGYASWRLRRRARRG